MHAQGLGVGHTKKQPESTGLWAQRTEARAEQGGERGARMSLDSLDMPPPRGPWEEEGQTKRTEGSVGCGEKAAARFSLDLPPSLSFSPHSYCVFFAFTLHSSSNCMLKSTVSLCLCSAPLIQTQLHHRAVPIPNKPWKAQIRPFDSHVDVT